MKDSSIVGQHYLLDSQTQEAVELVEHVVKMLAPSIEASRDLGQLPDLKPEQEAESLLCNELVRLLLTASNLADYLRHVPVSRILKALSELLEPAPAVREDPHGRVLN
jgi:hypothetical protein